MLLFIIFKSQILFFHIGVTLPAWESHVCKHTQDGLPIFPDDLAFAHLPLEAIPSTSGSTSEPLLAKVILEGAKAAKQNL